MIFLDYKTDPLLICVLFAWKCSESKSFSVKWSISSGFSFLTCPGWLLQGHSLSKYLPLCMGSVHSWHLGRCNWVYTQLGNMALGIQSSVGGRLWWGPWHKDRTHELLRIDGEICAYQEEKELEYQILQCLVQIVGLYYLDKIMYRGIVWRCITSQSSPLSPI